MDEFLCMKKDNKGDEFDLGPIHSICLAQGYSVEILPENTEIYPLHFLVLNEIKFLVRLRCIYQLLLKFNSVPVQHKVEQQCKRGLSLQSQTFTRAVAGNSQLDR